MRFELPYDFEITKPAEEWPNGLIVSEFYAFGITWDIKRSNGKDGRGATEPFYTYLRVAHDDSNKVWTAEYKWLANYHFPTLPGTIEPDQAAVFVGMMKTMWERGEKVGRSRQQEDFREVIGIK